MRSGALSTGAATASATEPDSCPPDGGSPGTPCGYSSFPDSFHETTESAALPAALLR